MKRYLQKKEFVWVIIVGLVMWNFGLTFFASSPKVVTLDVSKVAKIGAQILVEMSESDANEAEKDKLANRLRAVVEVYANKHRVVVLDISSIIAGQVTDITRDVIKELK